MQHGKDIPRACSSCFLINSCKAAKSNQKQNAVFDQRQFFASSGLMHLGFFYVSYRLYHKLRALHPQTSKSACKTAEKSAENNRKCTDKEQSRHKRGHLNFFTLSKLRKMYFTPLNAAVNTDGRNRKYKAGFRHAGRKRSVFFFAGNVDRSKFFMLFLRLFYCFLRRISDTGGAECCSADRINIGGLCLNNLWNDRLRV